MDKPVALAELFRRAGVAPLTSVPDSLTVNGVVESSADALPGALFVARKGETHDGHRFLADAARRGASAAVVERAPASPPASPSCGSRTAARRWGGSAPPSTASPRRSSSSSA
ncbi:MAG: hypothetical protein HYZ11_13180 [Candidatus Tectomicrobia bacterium]|uniref:Mur ligase N-terminal catalytic domain-containing protein n=1 Tax=Tectimicrobiota bacterium TaxID=2528274 RepID=A0A932HZJ8_UNCTE|nr:hypothetical protein [Candidatus Tectomicrobia bacterium]